jgi:hypothetical protein
LLYREFIRALTDILAERVTGRASGGRLGAEYDEDEYFLAVANRIQTVAAIQICLRSEHWVEHQCLFVPNIIPNDCDFLIFLA